MKIISNTFAVHLFIYTFLVHYFTVIQCLRSQLLQSVIDWVRGQPQFCLTREPVCGFGQKIVRESNKIAVIRPVYSWFVIHLKIFKIFLFTFFTNIYVWNTLVRQARESGWRLDTVACDVNITWFIESLNIMQMLNSSMAVNCSMNSWPVNRTVMHRKEFFVNSQNVVY